MFRKIRRQLLVFTLRSRTGDWALRLERTEDGHRTVYFAFRDTDRWAVVKLFNSRRSMRRVRDTLEFLTERGAPVPEVLFHNSSHRDRVLTGGYALVEDWLPGQPLTKHLRSARAVASGGKALAALHSIRRERPGELARGKEPFTPVWFADRIDTHLREIAPAFPGLRPLLERVREGTLAAMEGNSFGGPYGFCHMDLSPEHILVEKRHGLWSAGLIDLAQGRFHLPELDVARACDGIAKLDPAAVQPFVDAYMAAAVDGGESWRRWGRGYSAAMHLSRLSTLSRRLADVSRYRERGKNRRRALHHLARLLELLEIPPPASMEEELAIVFVPPPMEADAPRSSSGENLVKL